MWEPTALSCPKCSNSLYIHFDGEEAHFDGEEAHFECELIECDYERTIDMQEVIDND
ncbi:TPA: hypothetical protein QC448_002430 [Bacillus cereus]|nr:hypothetical protein [Bacillus cereus]HDR8491408.1 hypothetical protein [Bacillus cereus]